MRRWVGGVALTGLALGCQTLVGEYQADLETVDSAPLCTIERNHFVLELDTSSSEALPDLESYYEEQNPAFVERLRAVHEDFVAGNDTRGVTYLMGAAGVGKSFLLRNALGAFADEEQCAVELGDWYGAKSGSLSFVVEPAPDLATLDGSTVFNELPKNADATEFSLNGLLVAAECYTDGELAPLVVIDGIDEIHDSAATQLLEAVDEFVLNNDENRFVHFVLGGRPEGFWSWLSAPERNENNTGIVERFSLKAPEYTTRGDLDFRITGSVEFLELAEDPADVDSYITSTTQALITHPFLTYMMGNLGAGNFVVEQTAPGLNQDEQNLKAQLFDDLLIRNAGTHDRPGNGSALDGTYRRLLEDIAARYASEVDEEGTFTTRSEDTVTVTNDEGTALGEVRVRDVLNRSGIALLTSATTSTNRYHFDPFWLHAHLVERRNTREYPGREYRTCE